MVMMPVFAHDNENTTENANTNSEEQNENLNSDSRNISVRNINADETDDNNVNSQNVNNSEESLKKLLSERQWEQYKSAQEKIRDQAKALKEKFDDEVEGKRIELKAKIDEAHQNFLEKIINFRDENKKKVLSRIDENINKINAKVTDQLGIALSRMDDVMVRISDRIEIASTHGRDVTDVRAQFASSESALQAARNAVVSQSEKYYEIPVTDELSVGQAVRSTRAALHEDLSALRKVVKDAKDTIRQVVKLLKGIKDIDSLEVHEEGSANVNS